MSLWNGKAYWAFYRLKTDHSGIIAADGTGSVISSPAISDAALVLTDDAANEIIVQSSDWSADKDAVYTCTVETNDPAFIAFMDVACPPKKGSASSIVKKEYTSEAGVKIGGASASGGVPYLVINANAFSDTEVLTRMAIVTVSPESDKTKTIVGDTVMFPAKLTTAAAKAAVVIPNALFPTTIYDIDPAISAGDRTVAEDYYIKRSLLPIAA